MKEKVYLNNVAVDYTALFAKAKDYFHRHDIEIDFEFEETFYKDLLYTKINFPVNGIQSERIILQPYMEQVVPIDQSYDFTSFVFNGRDFAPPNIPTGFCYCPALQPFMDILTDELNPPDLDYIMICHEHMHALVIKATQKGFDVPDVMDTYYNNMQLENSDSNFGEQWVLLGDYVKSLNIKTKPKNKKKKN